MPLKVVGKRTVSGGTLQGVPVGGYKKLTSPKFRQGDWARTEDLIGKELVLYSYEEIATEYGEVYLVVYQEGSEANEGAERKTWLCGGVFLMQALRENKESLPMTATIGKAGRAYVFV